VHQFDRTRWNIQSAVRRTGTSASGINQCRPETFAYSQRTVAHGTVQQTWLICCCGQYSIQMINDTFSPYRPDGIKKVFAGH
jgi:hypothetical protein